MSKNLCFMMLIYKADRSLEGFSGAPKHHVTLKARKYESKDGYMPSLNNPYMCLSVCFCDLHFLECPQKVE